MNREVSSTSFEPYLLATQMQHSFNDVKALYFGKPSDATAGCPKVLSASRDKVAKAWMIGTEAFTREDSVDPESSPRAEAEADTLVELYEMQGHTDFLQCIAEDPSGQIVVTGSNDKTLRVWSASTGSLAAVLCGHDQAAKCLAFMTDSLGRTLLVSGGWDKKCCVWDIFGARRLIMDLYLHEQAVACICAIPCGLAGAKHDLILSSGGDKRIVLWDPSNRGKALIEFIGHTDTVQALAVIDAGRFVSVGNDGDLLVWDVPADATRHFQIKKVTAPAYRVAAHSAFTYAVAYDPASKLVFTGSEDKTIKVWSGVHSAGRDASHAAPPKNEQVILQPSIVWTICVFGSAEYAGKASPRGPHIAVAGGDGFIRVWTSNRARVAPPEIMEAFDAAVVAGGGSGGGGAAAAGRNNAENQPWGDPALLPTADQLAPPERDGQRAFVRGTAGEVELFTASGGQWQRIGTVVQSPEANDETAQGNSNNNGNDNNLGSNEPPPPRKKQFYKGKTYDYLFPIAVGTHNLVLPFNAGDSVFDAAQLFIYENGHLGVSIGDKEEIQQHIITQLHPADRDALAAGSGSGYSREHQNQQQQQHQNRGGAAAASSSSSQTQQLQSSTFEQLPNIQTIGTKLQEFGCQPDGITTLLEALLDPSASSTANETGALLLASASSLQLAQGQRLPYFDIVRVVAFKAGKCIDAETYAACIEGAVGASPGNITNDSNADAQKARDVERVMSMRAMANIAKYSPHINIFTASSAISSSSPLLISIRRVFLAPNSTALMKSAALAFIVNAALRLSNHTASDAMEDEEMESITALLQAVGAWLTSEHDTNTTKTLLLIAAEMIVFCKNDVVKAIAASGSSDILGPEIDRVISSRILAVFGSTFDEMLTDLRKALQ